MIMTDRPTHYTHNGQTYEIKYEGETYLFKADDRAGAQAIEEILAKGAGLPISNLDELMEAHGYHLLYAPA